MRFSTLFLSLSFSLTLSACGPFWGTEGVNPGVVNSGTVYDPSSNTLYTNQLVNQICEKRQTCLGVIDPTCLDEVCDNTGMTAELSVNPPYATLMDLKKAEYNNLVNVSLTELQDCEAAISALNCSDPVAQDSFSSQYENIQMILASSPSCAEIFTVK
jgi:hypothetical protein